MFFSKKKKQTNLTYFTPNTPASQGPLIGILRALEACPFLHIWSNAHLQVVSTNWTQGAINNNKKENMRLGGKWVPKYTIHTIFMYKIFKELIEIF